MRAEPMRDPTVYRTAAGRAVLTEVLAALERVARRRDALDPALLTDDERRRVWALMPRIIEVCDRLSPVSGVGWRPARTSGKRLFLNDDAVRDIRRRRAAGETVASIARRYGVGVTSINGIVLRCTYRHVADEQEG